MLSLPKLLVLVTTVWTMDCSAFYSRSIYNRFLSVSSSTTTMYPSGTSPSSYTRTTKQMTLYVEKKDDDTTHDEDIDEEIPVDPVTLAEIARLKKEESESSKTILNQSLLTQRIIEAVTSMAWVFVVGTIILNSLGYGYTVNENHMIRIDTLENQQFQVEMRKSMIEAAKEQRRDGS